MSEGAIIRVSDGDVYGRVMLGKRAALPGRITVSPAEAGYVTPNGVWKIVRVVRVDQQPGEFYRRSGETRELVGDTLTITQEYVPWSQTEIDEEMARREDSDVARVVDRKLGKVLYTLAKETRPTLTPEQFRAWVRSL